MTVVVRATVVVLGILCMLAGLAAIVAVPGIGPTGLWLVAVGALLILAPLIERQRYRSEAAEKGNDAPGPGGGESTGTPLDPRFRPTAEVFIDPTTGHRMRVLVDPRSGERRYVAEA
ncbi:MAG: hypothetical protein ABIV26_06665 [Candidatus Limnocylindrales bacterium]